MSRQLLISIFLLLLFSLFACKTPKSVNSSELSKLSSSEARNGILSSDIEFDWFYGKAKMKYDDGKKSQGFTAQFRIQRDSICWVSITSLMGIEVARILITNDSIHILDKLDKVYYRKPFSYINNFVPFNFNMRLLQDVLVGNSAFALNDKLKVKQEEGNYLLFTSDKKMDNTIWMNGDLRITKVALLEKEENRIVLMNFNDYAFSNQANFASEREYIFTGEQNISSEMRFTKVKWDEPQSFPFIVSSKYEERF